MLKKKIPLNKRQFKTKLKRIQKLESNDDDFAHSSQGELCHMMIPPNSPDSEVAGASMAFRGIPHNLLAKSKR